MTKIVVIQQTPLQSTNHILHLLLSIITGGLWVVVWVMVAMNVAANNRIIRRQNRAMQASAKEMHA